MPHGSIPGWAKLRAEMLAAQPDCACGAPAAELGHIIPRAFGGIDAWPNVVPQCSMCNRDLLYADRRAGGSVIVGLIRRPDEIRQLDVERWSELAAYAKTVGLDVLQGRVPAASYETPIRQGRQGHQEGQQGECQEGRADRPVRPLRVAEQEWSPSSAVI
jgi:HNH endonuclease